MQDCESLTQSQKIHEIFNAPHGNSSQKKKITPLTFADQTQFLTQPPLARHPSPTLLFPSLVHTTHFLPAFLSALFFSALAFESGSIVGNRFYRQSALNHSSAADTSLLSSDCSLNPFLIVSNSSIRAFRMALTRLFSACFASLAACFVP